MASLTSWAVPSIIIEICERAGIPFDYINIDGLEGAVEGFFMTADHDAFTGVSELARIYLFDASNFDSVLHFVPRGEDAAFDVPLEELLKQDEKSTRRDAIVVPRVMHVEYYDIKGGLNTDKQTSDRSLDSRARSEVKTNTPVLMPAAQAAQFIAINHKVAIEEQRGDVEFELSDKWLEISNADIVMLGGERLRIDETQLNDGFQRYKAKYDRKSAYQSTVQGVPVQEPLDPPTLIIGDTAIEIIDTHILRDADDRLGYYVAIAGTTLNWTGAVVELSKDGGQNYINSAEGVGESTIGTLVQPLAAHRHEWPDSVNKIRVQLLRDDMELESTDFTGMLNRQNLAIIGNELINFSTVEEVEPGLWELGYLLRGRKGTPAVAHLTGERFVLLEREQLFYVGADLFELNRQLTFRATSYGLSQGTVESIVFIGNTQRERRPAYLQMNIVGGDAVFTWEGVGRLGGGAQVAMGQFFTGYRLTVGSTVYNLQGNSHIMAPPPSGTVVSVQQVNALTGPGPSISITL